MEFYHQNPVTSYKRIEGKKTPITYCPIQGKAIQLKPEELIRQYYRRDPNYFEDITDISNADQTLADILNERFMLKDIILFNLRKHAKDLLECAKRAVEIAIEQDEQTAINWLESVS